MSLAKKLLIVLAALVVLLIGLLATGWWWLTATRSGAEFALETGAGAVERLEWQTLEGNLADGLVVTGVDFAQAGLRASARRLELAVRARPWWPPSATVHRLVVEDLEIHLPPPDPDPAPRTEAFVMPDLASPFSVELEEFLVDGLRVHPAGAETIEIRRIALAGGYGQELRIDRLAAEVPELHPQVSDLTLDARGRMDLSAPWNLELSTGLRWQVEPDLDQRVDLELLGPIEDLRVSLAAAGPVNLDGPIRLRGLPDVDALAAEAELAGRLDGWPGIEGRLENLSLAASGDLQAWRASAGFDLDFPELPPARAELAAEGDLESARIERADVAVLDGRIIADGVLRWAPELGARLELALDALDFTALYPEWPEQARLSGGMTLELEENLAIRDLRLNAPPAPLELTGRADVDLEARSLALELDWTELTWPPVLGEAEPLFSSRSGRLRAAGSLEDWRAELEAVLRLPEIPEGELSLRADGDRERARLHAAELKLGEAGTLSAQGEFGLQEPAADLEVRLAGFDPGAFVTQIPGHLDAEVGLRLEGLEPLALEFDLRRLEGELRARPVTGSGTLAVRDDDVHQAALELALGANRLSVTSDDGSAWQGALDAERLDQLWPGARGRLALEATVRPARGEAVWSGDGSAIGLDQYRLERVELSGRAGWLEQPTIDTVVRINDLDLNPWEHLDLVEIDLVGGCDRHRMNFAMIGMRANMDAVVSGRLPGCLAAPVEWDGRLERFRITETLAGNWAVAEPVEIRLDETGTRIGAGCLAGVPRNGQVCFGQTRLADSGTTRLRFEGLPVDLLLLAADPVFSVGSVLDGELELAWDSVGLERLEGRLGIGPGEIRPIDGDLGLLSIEGIDLSLDAPRPRQLEAVLEARLEGDSRITGRASIPDLSELATMRVSARGRLELPDLGAFNRMVPELDRMAGRLEGEINVDGPVTGPQIDGRLAIRGGELYYAPLGSRIEELELELDADETRSVLTGSFRAGEGRARLDGRLETVDAWSGELAVAGESLRLFDVSWLELTTSPDLKLEFAPERLGLAGEVRVDRARLGLPPGVTEQVTESADTVVLGEDDPEEERLPVRDIVGSVRLVLGDDVRFSAAGMQSDLAGELEIVWTAGEPMPRGRGAIILEDGSYRAYGQNLEVDGGEVLFTGFPIDNPRLDIEAVRDIFGDPRVEFAGVRIRGPAQDPEITLFTTPPTSEENALGYVLTGAEFDPSAGQGAFSVGMWVLPRVFVSYGLGLFDTGNVLAARFELSRHWGLRATSGERDTGADISFVIDR